MSSFRGTVGPQRMNEAVFAARLHCTSASLAECADWCEWRRGLQRGRLASLIGSEEAAVGGGMTSLIGSEEGAVGGGMASLIGSETGGFGGRIESLIGSEAGPSRRPVLLSARRLRGRLHHVPCSVQLDG
ncbi:unnamed protein product [Protopolystoma xenopodis]|uniref:Uncharacterized protein n=1 Tax=Protopolystoma xenopodis TaxID=117903 RepID=A0A448X6D4_9PLAT|nr:unnamed protein product [Protopolystoma xenopodis]